MFTRKPRLRPEKFSINDAKRLLQHGVIPGSSQTKARESALQERMRPASCGLATMESGNGILCRTGRIVEADIDLRGGSDGVTIELTEPQLFCRCRLVWQIIGQQALRRAAQGDRLVLGKFEINEDRGIVDLDLHGLCGGSRLQR